MFASVKVFYQLFDPFYLIMRTFGYFLTLPMVIKRVQAILWNYNLSQTCELRYLLDVIYTSICTTLTCSINMNIPVVGVTGA